MGWFRYCDDKDGQIVSSCQVSPDSPVAGGSQVVRFDLKQPNGEKKKQPFEQLLFWTWGFGIL